MTWLQLLAQAAVFATILGFFITVVAFLNGRHIRIGFQRTNEMIREMDERHTAILVRIDDALTKMDERHTAILAKMDGTLAKIDDTLAKMGEILAKMEENASRRHEELISIILGKGGSG
jgi:Ser/Thr protein kinase RdoA (MazF antagonist)